MRNSHVHHNRPGRWLLPLGCLVVLAYFGLHAFIGDRGILSHQRIETKAVQLKNELSDLARQRRHMEAQIALLNSKNLDPDMLDERVRAILNFAHPDDLVILRLDK
ncbi:MAG: FtsB family cell division protein [Alphaproteobacteria bacterium]